MTESKIDNSISEIKSNLKAINSWQNDREECIRSDLEDRIMEINQPEQQTEKQFFKKERKQNMISIGYYKTCQ